MIAHLVHARDIVIAPADRRHSQSRVSAVVPSEWAAFNWALYQKAAPLSPVCLVNN